RGEVCGENVKLAAENGDGVGAADPVGGVAGIGAAGAVEGLEVPAGPVPPLMPQPFHAQVEGEDVELTAEDGNGVEAADPVGGVAGIGAAGTVEGLEVPAGPVPPLMVQGDRVEVQGENVELAAEQGDGVEDADQVGGVAGIGAAGTVEDL